MTTVAFTQMKDGSREDYALLGRYEAAYAAGTADRILDQLRALGGGLSGYKVSRLEHSIQSAARAEADGADIDWIVATLLHDIGDELAPHNHDSIAAAVIRPFVRDQVSWVIQHHGIFQTVYYAHHLGGDPEARRKYADHLYYQDTVDFCERWDQASFDPDYPTPSLEHFEPMVRQVFTRSPWDAAVLRQGEREPLVVR
ncbi:MAG: HD domain-containing protein [Alphaproteobacteria bacterium]|nr:HD domain-containing protein [Alphaproteobacteria bacterium]